MDFFNSPNFLFMGTLLNTHNINTSYMLILVIFYSIISFVIESIDKNSLRDLIEQKTNSLLEYFLQSNKISIELTTHTVAHSIGYSDKVSKKKIYSDDFISLLDYIKQINICNKREILTTQLKDTLFGNRYNEDSSDNRYQFIPINDYHKETLICKKRKIYLKMSTRRNIDEDDKKNSDVSNDLNAVISIKYDKNHNKESKIIELNEFLKEIKSNYQEKISKKDDNQYIYVYQKSENIDDEIKLRYTEHINKHTKNFNNIIIEDKYRLISYVNKFKSNIDQNVLKDFEKMGMPYKAGMLFSGSPGTGKTSTVKAILKETKRHGIIINLSNIESNKELEEVFRNTKINGKSYEGNELCFVLEDCDATKLSSIKERSQIPSISIVKENDNNVTKDIKDLINLNQKGFDLSCFLNILDGIIELYGIMIIITTNHPDKIDEALIRPGRIDFKYEFKKLTKDMVINMLKLKFDLESENILKYKNKIDLIDDYILTPAECQCIMFQYEIVDECLDEILNRIKKMKNT